MRIILHRINQWLSGFCGWLLLAMMLLLTADIVGRTIGRPVQGMSELSVFVMMVVIYLGLARCEEHGEHVDLEFAKTLLPPRPRRATEILAAGLALQTSAILLLEARAYSQALSIIERIGMDLLRSGRKGLLSVWIQQLPKETSQEYPWVLLFQPMLRRFRMGREDIASLNKARELFKKAGNVRGHMISLSQLIVVSASTGSYLVYLEELIEEGENLLQSVEAKAYPYEEGTLSYCLGAGYILGQGDIRKGISLCQKAYLISKHFEDAHLQMFC